MPGTNRRFRFSLRTALLLLTGLAIAFAWFGQYANRRMAAFSAIRQAGGDIQMGIRDESRLEKWFGAELFGSVNEVNLRKGKADNELLAHIAALRELRYLDLSNADIDDEGLRRIASLPLRELWLQETRITDASAATLSQIKTLRFLQLNATSLSDAFLDQLQPLPGLENLGLRGTQVTSTGMKCLSRHPKLKDLDVYHTAVDDSGVECLVACPSLTSLGLSMTKVTNQVFQHLARLPNLTDVDLTANRPITTAEVLAFEKAHPQCDIEWYAK
jgi:hypothetical protein